MTKVEELEKKIQKLSHTDLAIFYKWFREFDSKEWGHGVARLKKIYKRVN